MLGYLIAGAAIGPWGLRLVWDVDSVLHFSEFGVVLMLFVIGLELEPKRLMAMRRAVFGGGALQLALCGAALAGGGDAVRVGTGRWRWWWERRWRCRRPRSRWPP